MNLFNRIVVIILLVAIIIGSVAFLLRPNAVLELGAGSIKVLQDQIADNQFFTYLVIGSAVVIFVMLLLLFLEFRRSQYRIARVQTSGKSDVWLGVPSIAKTIEYRVDELAGVRSVKPRVVSRGEEIEVHIDLDASPDANIISLTEQVTQLCTDIVENQLGLRLRGKVTLEVTQQPYPGGAPRAEASQPIAETANTTNGDSTLNPSAGRIGKDDNVIEITPIDTKETKQADSADLPNAQVS